MMKLQYRETKWWAGKVPEEPHYCIQYNIKGDTCHNCECEELELKYKHDLELALEAFKEIAPQDQEKVNQFASEYFEMPIDESKLSDSGDLVFELECSNLCNGTWDKVNCLSGDAQFDKTKCKNVFWVLKEKAKEENDLERTVRLDESANKCPACGEILELYTRDQMYEIWQAGCAYASSYDRGHPNKADDFKNAIQNI